MVLVRRTEMLEYGGGGGIDGGVVVPSLSSSSFPLFSSSNDFLGAC